ncbi:MAG TPA: saccharopine dehydrogenase NADP-binding domain-containing protein [Beutenbergiaceae bacterium]|nr:saccharopine dehydrogenase NADP-binding domain-containing protein [Beutenbergiaceae bacterium]
MAAVGDFDVTVFGASGFVGRLIARHLARHAPPGLRIALAGRNPERVESVRASLGPAARNWPVLTVDAQDSVALAQMARRSAVVVTTVGPYLRQGLRLIDACARAGTDYIDLTGDTLFIRESIERAHQLARRSGARIVHACGFDSIPSDLGVHLLHRQAHAEGAGPLTDTTLWVRSIKGGVSGGTVASMRDQLQQARRDPRARAVLADPHALSEHAARARGQQDIRAPFREGSTGRWVGPFAMATINTRIVRRSNALHPGGYGPRFRYREVVPFGPGWRGRLQASAMSAGIGALTLAMTTPGLSHVLDSFLPDPGQGPSAQVRAAGHFRFQIGTTTEQGIRYLATVAAQGDPGYAATAVMCGESALSLATDDRREGSGGVLTPARAMGDGLIERLRTQGFTIEATRYEPGSRRAG